MNGLPESQNRRMVEAMNAAAKARDAGGDFLLVGVFTIADIAVLVPWPDRFQREAGLAGQISRIGHELEKAGAERNFKQHGTDHLSPQSQRTSRAKPMDLISPLYTPIPQ